MPFGAVDWLPGLVALAVGVGLGGLYVWRMRAGTSPAPASEPPLERRDLLGKRDVLVRQLVELEDTATKRTPEQLARERYALELEAARVLRDLDRLGTAEAPSGVPERPVSLPSAGRPALRGFLWSTGTMAALVGVVLLVTLTARPREPGGGPTGAPPGGSASPDTSTDAEEATLRARVEQSPDDLEARLALARLELERQDMMGVWNETQAVLARSPGHPVALGYQAIVRLAMGQPDVARDMLEQAIAARPDMIDAYGPLSLAQLRLGQKEAAARTMAEAKRRFPEEREALTRLEADLLSSDDESAPVEGNPHAAVAPPPSSSERSGPAPEGAVAAGGPRQIAGQIDLDPSLDGFVGGVVFLLLRAPGVETGPPLAVQRLAPTSFPLRFAIGENDSMTGQPLPDRVRVEARLDSDGNPPPPPPLADPVAVGTSDLRLVLRPGS